MPKETFKSKDKDKAELAKDLIFNEKGFKEKEYDSEGKMNQSNDFIFTGQGGGTYERDADTNLAPGAFGFTMFSPRNKRIIDPTVETNFDANDKQKDFFFSDPSILAADNLNPGTSTQDETMYSDWKGQGVTSKEPFPAGAVVPQNKHIDQKNPTHYFQSGTNGNPATGTTQETKDGFILYDSGLAKEDDKPMYNAKLFETDGDVHTTAGKQTLTPNLKNTVNTPPQSNVNLQSDRMGAGSGSGFSGTRGGRGGRGARTTRAFAHGFTFNVTAADRVHPVAPNTNKVEMTNRNGDEMVSDTRNKPASNDSTVKVVPNTNIAVAEPIPGTTPLTVDVPESDLDRGMHFNNGANNNATFEIDRVPNNTAGNGDIGRAQSGDKDKEIFEV